ncbi:MAG TPA: signal recognition particle-docking protein FtsY [Anaerolineae bacterium]|nr:signal recognition particle-docking protein FtsY [Anaerolineae bacterium]
MFKKFRSTLAKTRNQVVGQLATTLGTSDITEETWEGLEETLVLADFGVETTIELVDRLRDRAEAEGIYKADQLIPALKKEMRLMLVNSAEFQIGPKRQLTLVLVVGVNGSGKTTSIGKLAAYYKKQGFKVRLAAGDTFRAAAIDQLKVWAKRADVPITAGQPGSDSAATIYDSIRAARARDIKEMGDHSLLFVDTAGRLHNKFNLMRELEKVHQVCQQSVHKAPHEVLLVVDAPTGQNAILQAQKFKESVGVTGVILTKLDGTAKGGMVFSIYRDLNLPVRFIGTGESIEDIAPFDEDAFIDAMFEEE